MAAFLDLLIISVETYAYGRNAREGTKCGIYMLLPTITAPQVDYIFGTQHPCKP